MINVVYNTHSSLAPKSGAERTAKHWGRKLKKAGIENFIIRPLDEERDIYNHGLSNLGIDIRSTTHYNELCYLVVYDDEQPRKYLTNESEAMSFEDLAGFFRTRRERRLERELILAHLNATQSLAVG